jgi:DNA polymerase III epsilon subunit family exonuclease
MAGFDQLGLFSSSLSEKIDKKGSRFAHRLNITVEFSDSVGSQKIDDMVRKLTKEIEQLDRHASISSSRVEDTLWTEQSFLALDVETTGLEAASNRIIELALVPYNFPDEVRPFCQLFSVGEDLSPEIVQITGISDAMLKNQPAFAEHADECLRLMAKASFIVAYNAKFDRPFLESEMARLRKVLPDIPWIDPFVFICELDRYKRGKKLADAAKRWGVSLENAHRALADAQAAGELMLKMADKIDCSTLEELIARQKILQWQNAHNLAELKRNNNNWISR